MILMYHRLGPESTFNTLAYTYFNEHISFLSNEFQCVSMDEYLNHLINGSLQPFHIALTFDDAYLTAIDYLIRKFPLLPIQMYVPVNFIGKENTWDKGYPFEIADKALLNELATSSKISLGSHGLSHKRLTSLDEATLKSEIVESKLLLERLFETSIKHFSFPFGQQKDIPVKAIDYLKQAGYLSAVTTLYGKNDPTTSPYYLKRIEVEPQDTHHKLKDKLKGWYYTYRACKQLVKNFI